MNIYHSGLTTKAVLRYRELFPEIKLNAMMSYGRREKSTHELYFDYRKHLNKIFLDSGTWTLNQNRKKYADKITSEGYMAFLRIFADRIDHYVNFDEDFSPDGFDTNLGHQIELEAAGFKPIPVIHDCTGGEIDYYIDKGYKYVALGSGELQGASLDDLRIIIMKFYCKGIKVHFLGYTRFRKLAYLPVYSCDSSTWYQAGARNHIHYWNPLKVGFDKTDKIYVDDVNRSQDPKNHYSNYEFRPELEEYLYNNFGLTIDDLSDKALPAKVRLLNRQVVNIHYFVELERIVNEKHKEQGFVFE